MKRSVINNRALTLLRWFQPAGVLP